jgi:hypothetical protein
MFCGFLCSGRQPSKQAAVKRTANQQTTCPNHARTRARNCKPRARTLGITAGRHPCSRGRFAARHSTAADLQLKQEQAGQVLACPTAALPTHTAVPTQKIKPTVPRRPTTHKQPELVLARETRQHYMCTASTARPAHATGWSQEAGASHCLLRSITSMGSQPLG